MEREGLDSAVIPFRQLLSQYERGIGRLGHFVSLAGIPLSFNTRDTPLSKMREGLDKMLTSFPPNLFPHGEGGIGRLGHFVSLAALRVTAGGRNP